MTPAGALARAAIAAALLGCKAEPPPRGGHLAELTGTVLEVAVRGDVLVARLDARGCPPVAATARAEVGGVKMKRADDADTGFGVEARGCSGRWTVATRDVPKGNVVVTLADDTARLEIETVPLNQKASFKLVSPTSLIGARAGDTVRVEAHGPGAEKLARVEVAVTTRRGEKLKLPVGDVALHGGTVGITLPAASASDGGGGPPSGELTVSAEADAVVRCEGAVRCAAPLKIATSFALAIRPAAGEK